MKVLVPLATLVTCSGLLAPPFLMGWHNAPVTPKTTKGTLFEADTLVPVKPDPLLPKPLSKPNLNLLTKNGNGATLKYVAIGGKLAAGYRDGGLYRQGQLTAYPNLIANQMGIADFQTPLFAPAQGNGTGYLAPKAGAPYPDWQRVENNTAIVQDKPLKLAKYDGGQIPDNLAFPEGPIFVSDMPDNMYLSYPDKNRYIAHYNRVLAENQEKQYSVLDLLKAKSPDLCTYETFFDEFLGIAEHPVNLTLNYLYGEGGEGVIDQHLIDLQQKGVKLVLFTLPQVMDFPYFHIFRVEALPKQPVFVRHMNNHINPVEAGAATLLLPTENVRNTFLGKSDQGLSAGKPFNDEDAISDAEARELRSGLATYNSYYVRRAGKKLNIPIVDLERLYQEVLAGRYVTSDGLPISGAFSGGNFFSSDGKTPSAVGQAVIANETIEVINQHYQTSIPLIDVGNFAKTIVK